MSDKITIPTSIEYILNSAFKNNKICEINMENCFKLKLISPEVFFINPELKIEDIHLPCYYSFKIEKLCLKLQ